MAAGKTLPAPGRRAPAAQPDRAPNADDGGNLRRLRRGRVIAVGAVCLSLLAVLSWTVVGVVGAVPRIIQVVDQGAERRLALAELEAALLVGSDGQAAAQRGRMVAAVERLERADQAMSAQRPPESVVYAPQVRDGLRQLGRFLGEARRLAYGIGAIAPDSSLAQTLRAEIPALHATLQAASAADMAEEMQGLYHRLLVQLLAVVVAVGAVGFEHLLGFRPMAARLEAAMAELARSRDAMAKEARSDKLTGLANRVVYEEALDREHRRIKRHGGGLALVVLDIDRFKKVNDTYGHDGGDRVLATTAQVVARCVRDVDIACRIGGEEFALVLPDTALDGALVVAERVRRSVERTVIQVNRKEQMSVTVSLGVAMWSDGLNPDALYKAADEQLYRAKQSGRNRVCVAEVAGGRDDVSPPRAWRSDRVDECQA